MEIKEINSDPGQLVDAQLIAGLKQKLSEIYQVLVENLEKGSDIGALTGEAGEALFLFNYAKYADDEAAYEAGITYIQNCVNQLNEGYDKATYCSGIAGFGWVLDHLEMNEFVDVGSDELLPALDGYIKDVMMTDLADGDTDFLHGAIGHAYYFLYRYRNTQSADLRKQYESILTAFIDLLDQVGHKNEAEGTIAWPIHDRYGSHKKDYSLSLSHGMASIIGLLTKLAQDVVFLDASKEMLEKSIRFVLNSKNENKDLMSLYPTCVLKGGQKKPISRLAWCDGDLGIGLQFWYAAQVLGDESLKKEAIDIMNFSIKRKGFDATGVKDSSICHGSFGNAQVFNRMYKISGDQSYRQRAAFWLQDGLNRAEHESGFAGYKQWRAGGVWSNETSVLEGIAGIGLVILDYLAEYPTHWDECLMIS